MNLLHFVIHFSNLHPADDHCDNHEEIMPHMFIWIRRLDVYRSKMPAIFIIHFDAILCIIVYHVL